jgi:hypothetical protein
MRVLRAAAQRWNERARQQERKRVAAAAAHRANVAAVRAFAAPPRTGFAALKYAAQWHLNIDSAAFERGVQNLIAQLEKSGAQVLLVHDGIHIITPAPVDCITMSVQVTPPCEPEPPTE